MAHSKVETPARAALEKWLESKGRGSRASLARQLGVDIQLVSQWASGACRPGHVYRQALSKIAFVPLDEWETDDERKLRERLEDLPDPTPEEAAG